MFFCPNPTESEKPVFLFYLHLNLKQDQHGLTLWSDCCCYYGLHTCDVLLSCKSQTPGNGRERFFSLHFPIQIWTLYLFQPGPLGTIGDGSGIQTLINVRSMFYSLLFWVLTDSKKSKDLVSPVSTGIWMVYLGFFSHITTFVGNEVDESKVSGLEKQSN